MKGKRHSPDQIIAKLSEADVMLGTGGTIGQVYQRLAVSEPTFHRWRHQHGGMKAHEAKRLKELEQENAARRREDETNVEVTQESERGAGATRQSEPRPEGRGPFFSEPRPTEATKAGASSPKRSDFAERRAGSASNIRAAGASPRTSRSQTKVECQTGALAPRRSSVALTGVPEALASTAT